MKRLLAGYSRFRRLVFPTRQSQFENLKRQQNPEALVITCADSRIVPDLLLQCNPGDLFLCRNAGNLVPPHGDASGGVAATVEYAVSVLGVKHIIVLGHSDCGAMHGVLHPERVANLPYVSQWLKHAEAARNVLLENYANLDEAQSLETLTKENVRAQLSHLRTHPAVAPKVARGALQLHGWVYQIETAEIRAYDAEQCQFVPLDATAPVAEMPHVLFQQAS